jgi:hypothetical protein
MRYTTVSTAVVSSTISCDVHARLDGRHKAKTARHEHKVVQLCETLMGGKMSCDKLQIGLNEQAREGWQLKASTAVEVKGRVGPGGVKGVLVTFERPLQ